MTLEEKIHTLAEILNTTIDSLLVVVPYNHRDCLEYLKSQIEEIINED